MNKINDQPKKWVFNQVLYSKFVRGLFSILIILLLLHIVVALSAWMLGYDQYTMLVKLVSPDQERNIPTAFSVFLLLLSSALFLLNGYFHLSDKKCPPIYWRLLGLGFFIMGFDEAFSYHEILIQPMQRQLGGEDLGFLFHAWVVPALVLVVVLGLFFLRFLLRLPGQSLRRFLLSGAVYLGGAIGVEMIGGYFRELVGMETFIYIALYDLEEGMEMLGLILLIRAHLKHIQYLHPQLVLSLRAKPEL